LSVGAQVPAAWSPEGDIVFEPFLSLVVLVGARFVGLCLCQSRSWCRKDHAFAGFDSKAAMSLHCFGEVIYLSNDTIREGKASCFALPCLLFSR
jgi:hypothetical protein